MAKKLNNEQAKNLAYSIFMTEENISDAELGEKVGMSRVTIGKWRREGIWDDIKKALKGTRENQLSNFVKQLEALNDDINTREGKNYPDYNEGLTQTQLAKNIERFKGDASLVEMLEHNKVVIKFIRANYPDKVKEWVLIFDELVKESM